MDRGFVSDIFQQGHLVWTGDVFRLVCLLIVSFVWVRLAQKGNSLALRTTYANSGKRPPKRRSFCLSKNPHQADDTSQ
jgi:hypothetical protein